ncbi:MAG: type II secretion system protein [bacterium]|nr:type II secretion system protein [bacterium]
MTRGMTLIEVLVAMAISGILLAALANLFGTFNALYAYQNAFRNTAGASGAVLHGIEAAALPSDRILSTHDFAGTSYGSGAGTLVLELPSIDASGAIVPGQYDYVAFYRSGVSAYRIVAASSGSVRHSGTTKLGDAIVSLSFSYDNADVTLAKDVTIDVVASTTERGRETASHLSETLRLRNF